MRQALLGAGSALCLVFAGPPVMAAGMDDQLSKPLTLAALTNKLLEWLAVAHPESEADRRKA